MTVDDMLANFEEVQLIHLTPDALTSEIANNEVLSKIQSIILEATYLLSKIF